MLPDLQYAAIRFEAFVSYVLLPVSFPERHPLDLIAGFEMDVTGRSYQSLADTLDYAYHVAGVVGVMMAMVMGVRSEPVLDRAPLRVRGVLP